MPLFQVVSQERTDKFLIEASTIADVVMKAIEKLKLPKSKYQVLLEKDGAIIDDDDTLLALANNNPSREYLVLMLSDERTTYRGQADQSTVNRRAEPVSQNVREDNFPLASISNHNILRSEDSFLTSSEVIKSLSESPPKKGEFRLIVDEIIPPKTVFYRNETKKVFNFVAKNNDNVRIEFVIWDPLVDKFVNQIKEHHVIHIDDVQPKIANETYNLGDIPLQFVFKNTTTIKDCGPYRNLSGDSAETPLTYAPRSRTPYRVNTASWAGVARHGGMSSNVVSTVKLIPLIQLNAQKGVIKTRGFVKSKWDIDANTVYSVNRCRGTICDDGYFIDVCITKYTSTFVSPFEEGEFVECVGSLDREGKSSVFSVESLECITRIDSEKATLKYLLESKTLDSLITKLEAGPSKRRRFLL